MSAKPTAARASAEGLAAEIKDMSFEAALAELEAIVENLERGEVGLDQAIAGYQRGALLKAHCEAKLREAEDKVRQITQRADGTIGAEPVDLDTKADN